MKSYGQDFKGDENKPALPEPYPPRLRDDAIMMAALERIERKLDLLLGKLSDGTPE